MKDKDLYRLKVARGYYTCFMCCIIATLYVNFNLDELLGHIMTLLLRCPDSILGITSNFN